MHKQFVTGILPAFFRGHLRTFAVVSTLFSAGILHAQQNALLTLSNPSNPSTNLCWENSLDVVLTRPQDDRITFDVGTANWKVEFLIAKTQGPAACLITGTSAKQNTVGTTLHSFDAPASTTSCSGVSGNSTSQPAHLTTYFTRVRVLDATTDAFLMEYQSAPLYINWLTPVFTLNNQPQSSRFAVYSCSSQPLELHLRQPAQSGTYCGNNFHLDIFETDASGGIVSVLVSGYNLTGTEITDMRLSSLDVAPKNTVGFTNGKYYKIQVVAEDQGWKLSSFFIQYLAKDVDLVMYDSPKDKGVEPTHFTENIYTSQDIWNRHYTGGAFSPTPVHQDPEYMAVPGNENRMYVRITNQGCSPSSGNTTLRMHWTKARTYEIWPDDFQYTTLVKDNTCASYFATGGSEITISPITSYSSPSAPIVIGSIGAGSTHTLDLSKSDGGNWLPPNPAWYCDPLGTSHPIICFVAELEDPADPLTYDPVSCDIDPFVRNNNNVITRNSRFYNKNSTDMVTNPITGDRDYGWATLLVNNPAAIPHTAMICFDELTDNVTTFTTYGRIFVAMDNDLWTLWNTGGQVGLGVSPYTTGVVEITNPAYACISNISLPAGSAYTLGLKFEYTAAAPAPTVTQSYAYSIQQHMPTYGSSGSPSVVYTTAEPGIGEDPGGPGEGAGLLGTDGVNAIAGTFQAGAFPNPFTDDLTLRFILPAKERVTITLTDAQGKQVAVLMDKEVNEGAFELNTSTANLAKGLYFIRILSPNHSATLKVVNE